MPDGTGPPSRARSLWRLAPAAVVVGALVAVAVPGPARAGAGDPTLVGLTNSARASAGLGGYRVCGDLNQVAQAWAQTLAARGSLSHNPSYSAQISGWRGVAENVGYGPSIGTVHAALMNSPGHRANILSASYTEIGVGSATGADGLVWVTENFRLPSGAGCGGGAPAPKPPAAPAPTPQPVAPAPVAPPPVATKPVAASPVASRPAATKPGAIKPGATTPASGGAATKLAAPAPGPAAAPPASAPAAAPPPLDPTAVALSRLEQATARPAARADDPVSTSLAYAELLRYVTAAG